MENDILISIIVLTYNPNFQKLCWTLDSIINQKNVNFEIIVSDDGSTDFDEDRVAKYIKSKNFDKFQIIVNKKNVGTNKNLYYAIQKANGKYIKAISPGDYLYNEGVIGKALNYMIENDYKVIFGKAVYFCDEDSKYMIKDRMNPINLDVYIHKNYKKIKKNYIYYQDLILGASFLCEKEILKKYLEKILDLVIYGEDFCFILMIADDIHLELWNEYFIWYECDSGISNSGNTTWRQRLQNDAKNVYTILKNEHKEYKRACDFYIYEEIHNDKTKYIFFRINRKIERIKNQLKASIKKNKKLSNIDKEDFKNLIGESIYIEGENNGNS